MALFGLFSGLLLDLAIFLMQFSILAEGQVHRRDFPHQTERLILMKPLSLIKIISHLWPSLAFANYSNLRSAVKLLVPFFS